MQNTWEQLPKTVIDPTTIEEAIDSAIDAHEADAEAHMGTGEALENHRENEVIDHPATSVPNDKLFTNARAYVAIVDPTSEEDFDTIAGAVSYADSVGGGNILIMPGTHLLGAGIVLNQNINLIGIDKDTCIISGGSDTDDCLKLPAITTGYGDSQFITNLTLNSDGGYIIRNEVAGEYTQLQLIFSTCQFTGDCKYIYGNIYDVKFTYCTFEANTNYALLIDGQVTIDECEIRGLNITGTGQFLEATNEGSYDMGIIYQNSRFINSTSDPFNFIPTTSPNGLQIVGCTFNNLATFTVYTGQGRIIGNRIGLASSAYFISEAERTVITGNIFNNGTGNRLRLGTSSDRNIVIGNQVGTAITNSGSNNIIDNNIVS